MKTIGCLIAGGQSTRMGKDKRNLVYAGSSFMQNSINLLNSTCDNTIISSNSNYNNYLCIKDIYPNLGPLGGIYSIFVSLKENLDTDILLLFIPVDMPYLNADLLKTLILKAHLSYNQDIIVTKFKNYVFPFIIKYNSKILSLLSDNIVNKKLSIKYFLLQLNTQELDIPNNFKSSIFNNINSLDDYKKIK